MDLATLLPILAMLAAVATLTAVAIVSIEIDIYRENKKFEARRKARLAN
jgi:hypothetical protein